MDKYLRPERFDVNPNSPSASKDWLHWKRTLNSFLSSLTINGDVEEKKLDVLINLVSATVYEYIASETTYSAAIEKLESLYVKPKNEVFARHQLATRKQNAGESIDEFLQSLQQLAKDCNFKAVTSEIYREEAIRDAFITGLSSNLIRQRLLETEELKLDKAYTTARSLDLAQRNSEQYLQNSSVAAAGIDINGDSTLAAAPRFQRRNQPGQQEWCCYYCGSKNRHPRHKCPAQSADCNKCNRRGHYAKVCPNQDNNKNNINSFGCAVSAGAPGCLQRAVKDILVNGHKMSALIDTGSSENFISRSIVEKINLRFEKGSGTVSMATSSTSSNIEGYCFAHIQLQSRKYNNINFTILSDLCADIILGQPFMELHSSITLSFGGELPPLSICSLACSNITPPTLFANLSDECYPIKTSSRRFGNEDRKFIDSEVQKLLKDGIIERSESPWRAQVVITTNQNHKKRLCIDYSQTINRYTYLDAYPMPRIDDQIHKIANYKVFSTLDLQSAYHQIPILCEDKKFTAFEANGKLYQFTRLPFGLTNAVAAFQREMDILIEENELKDTFAYLDNITIVGNDQAEHDFNLAKFKEIAKCNNLTFNEKKSIISVSSIKLLGYVISHKSIKPDPDRLRPLQELPVPTTIKEKQRAMGFFSYYSQFIPSYSEKVHPLAYASSFPLSEDAINAFQLLKKVIEEAVVQSIDEDIPFVVETDASDFSLAATLNQNGRPVAFFSKTLDKHELKYPSVEKEAQAIVEALRKWRHYLTGRHFTLITDQEAVSFMFDLKRKGKIKNDKIMRWRAELGCYSYDIQYRPGENNPAADYLTRVSSVALFRGMKSQSHLQSQGVSCAIGCAICSIEQFHNNLVICAINNKLTLEELHNELCHPGITRTNHFVQSRNLPYSIDEIKKHISSCPTCLEVKPRFYKPPPAHLIKSTQPFERLNIDFKGPLPSSSKNIYILTVVDEYSRFPFAFPCRDVAASTVIKCMSELFAIFGMPSYVHSDKGSSLISNELRTFLHSRGIATSNTTPYNPRGNGQVERYNGIVWQTISLALKSRSLETKQWESVLLDALHSIRSLLCTATNTTPHERLFNFKRRSTNGQSIPTWLTEPGKVFVKKHARASKYDPIVEEADLIHANPQYAHVRLSDGRETTVSIKDLAPAGRRIELKENANDNVTVGNDNSETLDTPASSQEYSPSNNANEEVVYDRVRSTRSSLNGNGNLSESSRPVRDRRPPRRYGFEDGD